MCVHIYYLKPRQTILFFRDSSFKCTTSIVIQRFFLLFFIPLFALQINGWHVFQAVVMSLLMFFQHSRNTSCDYCLCQYLIKTAWDFACIPTLQSNNVNSSMKVNNIDVALWCWMSSVMLNVTCCFGIFNIAQKLHKTPHCCFHFQYQQK